MARTTVHLISLGCARNDVDSEEPAGRFEAGGFVLVDGLAGGRAAHQGPEVDGATELRIAPDGEPPRMGDLVAATVVAANGADPVAEPLPGAGAGVWNEAERGCDEHERA